MQDNTRKQTNIQKRRDGALSKSKSKSKSKKLKIQISNIHNYRNMLTGKSPTLLIKEKELQALNGASAKSNRVFMVARSSTSTKHLKKKKSSKEKCSKTLQNEKSLSKRIGRSNGLQSGTNPERNSSKVQIETLTFKDYKKLKAQHSPKNQRDNLNNDLSLALQTISTIKSGLGSKKKKKGSKKLKNRSVNKKDTSLHFENLSKKKATNWANGGSLTSRSRKLKLRKKNKSRSKSRKGGALSQKRKNGNATLESDIKDKIKFSKVIIPSKYIGPSFFKPSKIRKSSSTNQLIGSSLQNYSSVIDAIKNQSCLNNLSGVTGSGSTSQSRKKGNLVSKSTLQSNIKLHREDSKYIKVSLLLRQRRNISNF